MASRPNVVLVVLDSVRRDRVSAYGYDRQTTPAFDAFADGATLFTDALSQSSWSVPSHASLLTGAYPGEHGATTVRPVLQAPAPLPARLRRVGYRTYAVSPNRYVRPALGFGSGFDEFHTGGRLLAGEPLVARAAPLINGLADNRWVRRPIERLFNRLQHRGPDVGTAEPPGRSVTGPVRSILDRTAEPFFLLVNVPHAHLPRSPRRRHREAFVDEDLPTERVPRNGRTQTLSSRTMDAPTRAALEGLYDADVRTADDCLGTVLAALSEQEFGETVVAVTADHGEHLGERGLVGHQHSLLEPVVSVPLAVDVPGREGAVIEAQVETRRLYHTLLDVTRTESHPDRSLLSGSPDERARGSFHSPMLDIHALLNEGRVEYDRRLLGEPYEFERTAGRTRFSFDGRRWEAE